MVRSTCIESSDLPTHVNFSDVFKAYNTHGEELFGTEEMDTSPHQSVPPRSLTNNNENNRACKNNYSITFTNDTIMETSQPDIDPSISLSCPMFKAEDHISLSTHHY